MQELRTIETDDLIDLLSVHTSDYLRLSEDPSRYDEFAKCYLTIKAIQEELEERNQRKFKPGPSPGSTDPNSRPGRN